jgi:hypothetical protein
MEEVPPAQHPAERHIPATLYYICVDAPGERFYEIGITKTEVKARFANLTGLGGRIRVLATKQATLETAFDAEQATIARHGTKHSYRPKLSEAQRGSVVGATECFDRALPSNIISRYFG